MPNPTPNAPASMYRSTEGVGVWPHRGKVAAVGVGHSPTMRRWDEQPEHTVGGLSITALRKAIDDAGVSPDQIDGLVLAAETTTGSHWPVGKPLPEDFLAMFQATDDPLDGI